MSKNNEKNLDKTEDKKKDFQGKKGGTYCRPKIERY